MKKAWDATAVTTPAGPSYDGVYLSHGEWSEMLDDGVRAITAKEVSDMRSNVGLDADDQTKIVQRDLGFNRIVWTCPLSLIEKASASRDFASRPATTQVPHLRLASG